MTQDRTPNADDVLLLVDDDPDSLALLQRALGGCGFRLVCARSGEEALELASTERPMLALLDVVMDGIDGYEVCARLKQNPETRDCAVIFLSALDETTDKVRGLELGAVDYLAKPFHRDEVKLRVETHRTILRLQRQLLERNAELEHELHVARELRQDALQRQEGYLLGDSLAVQKLRGAIKTASESTAPVLLISGAGAGDEAVARSIHELSPRSRHPFIFVDCLTPSLSSEALFGPAGKWRLSSRGTIYFYRLGSLPTTLQCELASKLVEGKGSALQPRVIAFDRDGLSDAGADDSSRRLLADSASWLRLTIPPLIARRDDLPLLVQHFLTEKAARLDRQVEGLTRASMERVRGYRWPGNLDELRSVMECAILASSGPLVEIDEALLDAGRRIGNYQLVRKIGSGGMGEVWLAKHRLLIRPAAVKLIQPGSLTNPAKRASSLKRFEQEARITAALESPNTVRLYDFGLTDDGDLFYVMERLRGLDLDQLVRRFGPVPMERALYLVQQACGSLAEAHREGLVHRDIKPANLFACRLGLECDVLKVVDFGLVRTAAQLSKDPAKKFVGTPAFASAESANDGGKPVDQRSDLYSLGCVLYWLLTGCHVFPETTVEGMLRAHAERSPEPPSRLAPRPVPKELDDAVLACLAKAPSERPSTAEELRSILMRVPTESPWGPDEAIAWWSVNDEQISPASPSDAEDDALTESKLLIGTSWAGGAPSAETEVFPKARVQAKGGNGQGRREPIVIRMDPEIADLIPGYLERRRLDAEQIGEAIAAGEWEQARRLAHSIHGTGGSFGFARLTELGGRIERSARASDAEAARRGLEELRDYLERVEPRASS